MITLKKNQETQTKHAKLHGGKNFHDFFRSFFVKFYFFEKSSEGQTAWIQIQPDILFVIRLSADDTIFVNNYILFVCVDALHSSQQFIELEGVQWLSGRVLDSRPRGRCFEPGQLHCIVSLSKNINPSLELVQPWKTRPYITERLLMGRK